MSKEPEIVELDRDLELRDKIDYQAVLSRALLWVQKMLAQGDIEQIHTVVRSLEAQTPSSWYDNKFLKAREESELTVTIDIRPLCCGVPLNKKLCEKNNIPIYSQTSIIDPLKRLHAIVDLWDRKNYTSRKTTWEESSGIPFDKMLKILDKKHLLES